MNGGRVIPSIEETQLALVLKEPYGGVAAIVPWNYPIPSLTFLTQQDQSEVVHRQWAAIPGTIERLDL